MDGYLTAKEVAEKWNLTTRRVQKMCEDGDIIGVVKFGKAWAIPADAERPEDGRITTGEYRDWRKKKDKDVMNNEIMLMEYEKKYLDDIGIKCFSDLGDFELEKTKYHKIDPSTAGKIDALMQNIPNVLLAESKRGDVYRVIYDKGLGELQKAANNPGFYRGNVVAKGTNNRIKGSVLLQEISFGPQMVSGVFSAMSVVTGQYYMSQMNTRIDKMEKNVEGVLQFLENDKRSQMESEEEFLKNIGINYQSIIYSDDLRKSTLENVQKIKMNSSKNINFFRKQINDSSLINVNKNKLDDILSNIQKIRLLISEYWYSLYLYCCSSCIEPVVGRVFDREYIDSINKDMKKKCNQYKEDYNKWNQILDKYVKNACSYDKNKIIKAMNTISKIPVYSGKSYLDLGRFIILAGTELAGSVEKDNKEKKRKIAFNALESLNPFSDIKIIESKQEELMYFSFLNNNKLEFVKYDGEMYIKLPPSDL